MAGLSKSGFIYTLAEKAAAMALNYYIYHPTDADIGKVLNNAKKIYDFLACESHHFKETSE